MHTVWSQVPKSSFFVVEIAIQKLKEHKSPRTDQILAGPIQAGGNTLHSEIHKLNPVSNNGKFPEQWKGYVIKLPVVIIEGYHCHQPHIKLC
jgi:hypothetical protein